MDLYRFKRVVLFSSAFTLLKIAVDSMVEMESREAVAKRVDREME